VSPEAMAACNCTTVASLNRVGTSPESLRSRSLACRMAGADNAPAMDAPVPASALHFRKSRRATPFSSFGGWGLFHNVSRKFCILRRRRLLLGFIIISLVFAGLGVVVEQQPIIRLAVKKS